MPVQAVIKRYFLIYQKVKVAHYPSIGNIMSYLEEEGFQLSERTVKRDIAQLRDEFGIDILYDPTRNGYYMDEESNDGHDRFIRLLEIMTTAGLIAETLKDGHKALEYLSFESSVKMEGIQFLDKILNAIRKKRVIQFNHHHFETDKAVCITLKPCLLREYRQRWYVVGLSGSRKTFTIYGIDRISDLKVTPEKFVQDGNNNPVALFDSIIGLNYDEHKEQEVVLSFTPGQGRYIKTLPIHHSQKILVDDDQELSISLYLRPNFELKQILLSYGDRVKIVQPAWLKDEIIAIYKNAISQYRRG